MVICQAKVNGNTYGKSRISHDTRQQDKGIMRWPRSLRYFKVCQDLADKREEIYMMTERQLKNHIEKLDSIAEQQKALGGTGGIQTERNQGRYMQEKGVEKLTAGNCIAKWKEIISHRLDGKALKLTSWRYIASSRCISKALGYDAYIFLKNKDLEHSSFIPYIFTHGGVEKAILFR